MVLFHLQQTATGVCDATIYFQTSLRAPCGDAHLPRIVRAISCCFLDAIDFMRMFPLRYWFHVYVPITLLCLADITGDIH